MELPRFDRTAPRCHNAMDALLGIRPMEHVEQLCEQAHELRTRYAPPEGFIDCSETIMTAVEVEDYE